MAGCSTRKGAAAARAGNLDEAAAAFARAAVFLGDAPEVRHNRAVVELRLAEPHARAGRCDDARPHVRRAVDFSTGNDVGVEAVKLLEWCANERASAAAKKKQWSVAVDELRRGLRDAPESHALRENLTVMLHNSAVDDLRAKRCDEARALLPELRDRHDTIVDDISRRCP
jgi:tetratricopeptide (TPR) repeat protein